MAENEIFKSGKMSVDVAPRTVGILKTSIQFSTQDQGTAKLIFSLSKDGLPLPLSSAATAKIFLRMADGSVFEKIVSIVDQIHGKLEYVLEEEISHPGLAKGELNINYANGQALSVCKFSFNIDASLMDQDIVPLAEYYVKNFNTLQTDIEERAAVINDTVDELQEKVDGFETTAITLDPRLKTVEGKVTTVTAQLAETMNFLSELGINIKTLGSNKDKPDNIDFIQATINEVSARGGGTVYIPPEEFIIAPTTTRRIILKDNVTITGTGTVKVKDNAGDYETIFGAATNGTQVKNVHFRGFKIDQNPKANITSKITIGTANTSQFAISFQNFKNITVKDVKFDKCSGVNTVLLSGRGCRDASVKDCEFYFAKPLNHANYDNSAIYFNCEHHQASGNKFYADLAESAGGAIETHNGLSTITNNTSEGYSTVCNIVSSSVGETVTRDNSDMVVSDNVATKCRYGIRLWSITGKKLSNVIISNNVMSINNADRGLALTGGISMVRDTGLDGDFENITISDNTIHFQKDTVLRSDMSESSMFAIGLAVRGKLNNVSVKGNTINNAPVRAIKLGFTDASSVSSVVEIKDNIIVNAGIYALAGQYYRSAIQLEGNLNHVSVEGNNIHDNNDIFGGFLSIDANSGTFKGVSIKNNKVSSKQGGYYYRVNKSLGIDEGEVIKTHYSSVFPPTSKLNLKIGDKVENTGTLTPGTSYTGYRVTTAGTSGTLTTAITGTCTNGSTVVTVSDSSQLSVGDMILIAGSGKAPSILQITGNTLLMSSTYSASVTDGSVSYYAPVLKGYGQLQA
ncbi:hypothetical protein AS888_20865 [Peribacillus simplex]|uniref:BppU N-terminal domain-containing protein n=1 Tax=Peribacillus simplex TaxID=1478 RepID=A0A109MXL4_9BACI|nr:BppU family phage baseplate upper protein [Peribacillus simplex]KWW17965.1 hypothetical protein AS888_20865 [Peribacillus simplex]